MPFSEFNRLGVLEAQFFENNESFSARPKLSPDPAVRDRFQEALDHAQRLARARLSKDAKDRDGLFAMTLASGLQADYAALIEKRTVLLALHQGGFHQGAAASCGLQRLRRRSGVDRVQQVYYRQHDRTGALAAKHGGIARRQAGWDRGLTDDSRTRPLSETFCAHSAGDCLRADKDKTRALELLVALHTQFPGNTLFPREIARLTPSATSAN